MLSWYFVSTSGNVSYLISAGTSWQAFVPLLQPSTTPKISLFVCSVAVIIFDISSATATTWYLENIFLSPVKFAIIMRNGTFRLTFWIPQAALHSMCFSVNILAVMGIWPSRSVGTVITAWLTGGIRTRCVDRILEDMRFLRFGTLTIFRSLVTTDCCLP